MYCLKTRAPRVDGHTRHSSSAVAAAALQLPLCGAASRKNSEQREITTFTMGQQLSSTCGWETAEERAAQRRADKRRSKYRKPVSVLPWALLDELQAEKDKFTQEKALAKLQNMKEMNEKESKAKALKN